MGARSVHQHDCGHDHHGREDVCSFRSCSRGSCTRRSALLATYPYSFPWSLFGSALGLWDFPLEPLPDFPPEPLPDIPMEPMSPGLPVAEPKPAIPMIEISSTATSKAAATSPPLLEYHLDADPSSEEDPSEVRSLSASYTQVRPDPATVPVELR